MLSPLLFFNISFMAFNCIAWLYVLQLHFEAAINRTVLLLPWWLCCYCFVFAGEHGTFFCRDSRPSLLKRRCRLTHTGLYHGHKTVVVLSQLCICICYFSDAVNEICTCWVLYMLALMHFCYSWPITVSCQCCLAISLISNVTVIKSLIILSKWREDDSSGLWCWNSVLTMVFSTWN